MKKRTSKRKMCKKRVNKTQKRRNQRGGDCGCNNSNPLFGRLPLIHGGEMNELNNSIGGKYKRKQTPYYPRKKNIRGGNPISSFGTTSGIPFSSNTLFGISNSTNLSMFGKHNLPLV
jgi:hypothetical protein